MAARFWRWIIACELTVAVAVGLAAGAMRDGSWIAGVLGAVAALVMLNSAFIVISWALGYTLSPPTRAWPGMRYLVRALSAEAGYFGLMQLAMSVEPALRRRDVAALASDHPARPVLLIHGILCNRAIWRPLCDRLRESGFGPIHAANLEPLAADIESLAANLKRDLISMFRESRDAPVSIVAHSMGGLVARSLLQAVDPRFIRRIVTVASPHHGTELARCLAMPAARQMRPESPWLLTLNAAQEGNFAVPITSIYSREDELVMPPQSAELRGAESVEMRGVGHFGLLYSRCALDAIMFGLAQDRPLHELQPRSR